MLLFWSNIHLDHLRVENSSSSEKRKTDCTFTPRNITKGNYKKSKKEDRNSPKFSRHFSATSNRVTLYRLSFCFCLVSRRKQNPPSFFQTLNTTPYLNWNFFVKTGDFQTSTAITLALVLNRCRFHFPRPISTEKRCLTCVTGLSFMWKTSIQLVTIHVCLVKYRQWHTLEQKKKTVHQTSCFWSNESVFLILLIVSRKLWNCRPSFCLVARVWFVLRRKRRMRGVCHGREVHQRSQAQICELLQEVMRTLW